MKDAKTKIVIVVPTIFIESAGGHVEQGRTVEVSSDDAKALIAQGKATAAPKPAQIGTVREPETR